MDYPVQYNYDNMPTEVREYFTDILAKGIARCIVEQSIKEIQNRNAANEAQNDSMGKEKCETA